MKLPQKSCNFRGKKTDNLLLCVENACTLHCVMLNLIAKVQSNQTCFLTQLRNLIPFVVANSKNRKFSPAVDPVDFNAVFTTVACV